MPELAAPPALRYRAAVPPAGPPSHSILVCRNMLDALRSKASSWVVKAFLGLLILSFAVWGIGDIFLGPRGGNVAATVADREITTVELDREFEAQLRRMSEQFGIAIDRNNPLAANALNEALQRLIARRLVDAYVSELGVGVSDEEVAEAIRSDPNFTDAAGNFERGRLELFLRSVGITEKAFVDEVRAELARSRLLRAIAEPVRPSDFLARFLYDYRNEERTAEALLVQAAAMEVAEPDDATLEAWLEENRDAFRRPEFRKVVIALIGAEDLVEEISVPEEEVRQLYESRRSLYTAPERREIAQLLLPDEDTAREARRLLGQGRSFEEVARALEDKGARFSLVGPVERSGLPAALAETAFALSEGEIGEPVRTPFGWHILRVVRIEPERVADFAEKKAELERELALEKATDQLPDFAATLDDEIAAGVPLEEAAEKLGIRLLAIAAVDREGKDPEGRPVAPDDLTPDILEAVFAAPAGEPSLLEETRDGRYFLFRVDEIQEARPLTLAEARDRVREAWRREQQQEAARALADRLLEEARAGRGFAELEATATGVVRREVGPLKRGETGAAFGLTPSGVRAIFTTEKDALVAEPVETPEGVALLRVTAIEPAPEPEDLTPLRDQLRIGWRSDLFAQFEGALRARYAIEVNQQAMATVLGAGG